MGDKVGSGPSFSGGSHETGSSTDSSSGGSEGEEESTETLEILGHTLELPQELCENYEVFKEFFSMETWQALDDKHKETLKQYLPTFPDDDEEENEHTVKQLFNFEPFHFTSPMDMFYTNLRNGNYRPDIAKMRKFLMNARRQQQKHRIKAYYAKLLPEVLIARERLLAAARGLPPGRVPPLPPLSLKRRKNFKPAHVRAKQRYFEELASIRKEVGVGGISDDENYPEGPPEVTTVRSKSSTVQHADTVTGTLSRSAAQPSSLECLKSVLAAHRARRHYRDDHPELNVDGITLEDIKQRVAFVNGAKKLMFGGQKANAPVQKLKRGPKKDPDKAKEKAAKKHELETVENKPLLPNIKIKCEKEESDSEASFVDPVASPKVRRPSEVEVKQETIDTRYSGVDINNFSMECDAECVIKQEPEDPTQQSRVHQPVPIKLEDLDGIDMMALPIEIADDCGEVVTVKTTKSEDVDPDEALTETTYANFLSLVRALFPARSAHRASKQQLKARCKAVMSSPIAPLNTWYSLCEDWCAQLQSALEFLAGERGPHPDDFVPYLQLIPHTQMYQWIGAGRDGDATLGRLCERWLRWTRADQARHIPQGPKVGPAQTVPVPTAAELADFHRQERKRFANAAKPFTYHHFGYSSVVGPCARAASGPSAAGSGALAGARPAACSLSQLVRDALGRLPGGQGSAHCILRLLSMSQWILPGADQSLWSAVSSTLDRLRAAKRDPVVKYCVRTQLWTYLHRNRTEEDWLAKCSGRRGKAAASKAARDSNASANVSTNISANTSANTSANDSVDASDGLHTPAPHVMTEAQLAPLPGDSSESEVDVLCASPPPGQLSSAQLLRTTLEHHQPPPPSKLKGRLVAVSPQKAKNIMKHAVKPAITPPTKQSNLVTQAIEQANQLAQTTKQNTQKLANITKQSPSQKVVPKQAVSSPKATTTPKPSLMAQSAKQASAIAQLTKPPPKNVVSQPKPIVKQSPIQTPPQTAPRHSMSKTPVHEVEVPKLQTNISKVTNVSNQSYGIEQKSNISKENIVYKQETAPKVSKETVVIKHETNIAAPKSTSKPTIISNIPLQPHILQSHVIQQKTPSQVAQSQVSQSQLAQLQLAQSQLAQSQVAQSQLAQSQVTQHQVAQNQVSQHQVTQSQVAHQVSQSQLSQLQLAQSQVAQHQVAQNQVSQHQVAQSQLAQIQLAQSQVAHQSQVSRLQKTFPTIVASRSPLIKQRPLLKQDIGVSIATAVPTPSLHTLPTVLHTPHTTASVSQAKIGRAALPQAAGGGTRSLLLRAPPAPPPAPQPPAPQPAVHPAATATATGGPQPLPAAQAQPASGQRRGIVRVLSPAGAAAAGKSLIAPRHQLIQQGVAGAKKRPSEATPVATVAQSVAAATDPPAVPSLQLQLSSLQLHNLGTHTVRLPSGQTVQLASPTSIKLAKHTPNTAKPNTQSPTFKPQQQIQIPISSVQLTGQTVQIGGQTVQIAGQSVQLTGHTVKLPSGQSVQMASPSLTPQNVIQRQVQLTGNLQTVQLGQVQLGGQTVQLPSGQTIQLASGQTIQLASGQTVQLGNVKAAVKSQAGGDAVSQPIVAKLVTNTQSQAPQSHGGAARPVAGVPLTVRLPMPGGAGGARLLAPRMQRPLLLHRGKPVHNIILQQSDGTTIRVTSAGAASTSQAIVFSNIGAQAVTTSTTSAPVLKLQQVNQLQQVKIAQGIKIQQPGGQSGAVRGVVMDGQQLKLVRILQHYPPH